MKGSVLPEEPIGLEAGHRSGLSACRLWESGSGGVSLLLVFSVLDSLVSGSRCLCFGGTLD